VKPQVLFTPEAKSDLLELYEYIAERGGPERAIAYVERIEKACLSLRAIPERGTLREDLRSGLRVMGFERRAMIAFRVKAGDIAILRILYGGRSLERTFSKMKDIE